MHLTRDANHCGGQLCLYSLARINISHQHHRHVLVGGGGGGVEIITSGSRVKDSIQTTTAVAEECSYFFYPKQHLKSLSYEPRREKNSLRGFHKPTCAGLEDG